MADSTSTIQSEELQKIEAFDLVTDGLMSLDAYKRTSDKSHLKNAETVFNEALKKLKGNETEPLYSRAEYFLAMVEYLNESPEKADRFKKFIRAAPEIGPDWSAWDAEAYYNAGAAWYSQKQYETSAAYFGHARNFPAAAPEVRLLAGAGLVLSMAQTAKYLSSKNEQQAAWKTAKEVKALSRELGVEIVHNFFRRLVGARHVEVALSRKARKLIDQALDDVSRISPPRPQTPPVKKPAEPGNLAGAT